MGTGTHSARKRLVTGHIGVQILGSCKAFSLEEREGKKGLIVVSVARMHADELLEKGIGQNEKQGMKGPWFIDFIFFLALITHVGCIRRVLGSVAKLHNCFLCCDGFSLRVKRFLSVFGQTTCRLQISFTLSL